MEPRGLQLVSAVLCCLRTMAHDFRGGLSTICCFVAANTLKSAMPCVGIINLALDGMLPKVVGCTSILRERVGGEFIGKIDQTARKAHWIGDFSGFSSLCPSSRFALCPLPPPPVVVCALPPSWWRCWVGCHGPRQSPQRACSSS